jgi:hypothetical protein
VLRAAVSTSLRCSASLYPLLRRRLPLTAFCSLFLPPLPPPLQASAMTPSVCIPAPVEITAVSNAAVATLISGAHVTDRLARRMASNLSPLSLSVSASFPQGLGAYLDPTCLASKCELRGLKCGPRTPKTGVL